MVIYISLTDDEYVDNWGTDHGEIKIDLPKTHRFFITDMHSWRYENNQLTYDDERNKKRVEEREKEEQKISKEERNEMAMLELASLVAELKGEL